MASIDNGALCYAIQSIAFCIKHYEQFSKSETCQGIHDEYLFELERALMRLKEAYEAERKKVSNLRPFDELVGV